MFDVANSPFIITETCEPEDVRALCGGKAANLARMVAMGCCVPTWYGVSASAFERFIAHNQLELTIHPNEDALVASRRISAAIMAGRYPEELVEAISSILESEALKGKYLAVRSSGLVEDSVEHSFAGQFSSFLFQKGFTAVCESIKACWASGFSERVICYRRERSITDSVWGVGVVIQQMVDSDVSGVAFSRNPLRPYQGSIAINAVYGQGEGLVSGAIAGDEFDVSREDLIVTSTLTPKTEKFVQNKDGGVVSLFVDESLQNVLSLTERQAKEVARLALNLENQLGYPQDVEWAYHGDLLYCLQTRPITTLPANSFFNAVDNGDTPILWDNSNIIESYSGVTLPLTFSFASHAYEQVYIQFCEVMGVPKAMIRDHSSMYRNMLGSIRGHVFYNLVNWYRLIMMLPGAGTSGSFMETMMGVKQSLDPKLAGLFEFTKNPPRFSLLRKSYVMVMTLVRFLTIESIIQRFQHEFDVHYQSTQNQDLNQKSLAELAQLYSKLSDKVLGQWQAPIINDYLCMIFFGVLTKLTSKWINDDKGQAATLQNDLLCGQGDLKSTEPTKMLMRIAAWIDSSGQSDLKNYLLSSSSESLSNEFLAQKKPFPEFYDKIAHYLHQFGFRCVNELKLESIDLHDDPSFIFQTLASYVRTKSYDIDAMAMREHQILSKAEDAITQKLAGKRLKIYNWVLKHTRKVVANRENLRFDRTKIFGLSRRIFIAMGHKFQALGVLDVGRDIFYLTTHEIIATIEGRSVTTNLKELVVIRKREYQDYESGMPPPDRLITRGAATLSNPWPAILNEADLLAGQSLGKGDEFHLYGTPCCPGKIEGIVRVAHNIKDTEGMNGEILVTARTDPGWVPLYPSCGALLIERGSLLSHSAVVARELGLPTIVGISGGLMTRLKTGMRVRIDAGKGEVRILQSSNASEGESAAEESL